MTKKGEHMKKRRDGLRAAGRCINGPKEGHIGRTGKAHGPPVKSGKCEGCIAVWKKTQ